MRSKAFIGTILVLAAATLVFGQTNIYRSVGPGNTSDLNTGGATVEVVGGVANFSAEMPPNIGVGDAVVYSTSGFTALAFIHGRLHSKAYLVADAAGASAYECPPATQASVYRAYTSLENVSGASENTGIPSGVRDFDDWPKDITATGSNQVLNIACYGDNADNTRASFGSWTNNWKTSSTNYIRIYTPVSADEVGVSQRHTGVWTTGAYSLVTTATSDYNRSLLLRNINYLRVEGLQIHNTNSGYASADGIYVLLEDARTEANSHLIIQDNIIKGTQNGGGGSGIKTSNGTVGTDFSYVFNNIVYGFGEAYGIMAYGHNTVYGNTVSSCKWGIRTVNGSFWVKNNAVFNNNSDWYINDDDTDMDYNSSDDQDADCGPNWANISPGAVEADDWNAAFVDYANGDFHAKTGSVLREAGVDLGSQYATDIDGQPRPMGDGWDIGADEGFAPLQNLWQQIGETQNIKNLNADNVGIGVADPTEKLSVGGNLLLSAPRPSILVSTGDPLGSGGLSILPYNNGQLSIITPTSATGVGLNSTIMFGGQGYYNNNVVNLAVSGNVEAKGNIEVDGTIKVGEWTIRQKDAPDYVFEKDYRLMSLKDVEAYVKKHKHLPEVPSAAKIEQEGLDLVKMNLLLLKKLEEITLHCIEQDKRIGELERQVR